MFKSRMEVVDAIRNAFLHRGDFFHALTPNNGDWRDVRRSPLSTDYMLYRYPEFLHLFDKGVFDRDYLEAVKALHDADSSWLDGKRTQAASERFETLSTVYLSQ